MNERTSPGDARRQRMLRELRKEHRDPLEKFTAMVAVLAIFLVAAFALMEARYGVAESRYVPVAAAQPQPPSNEKRPTPSPVRFLGSPASSAVH